MLLAMSGCLGDSQPASTGGTTSSSDLIPDPTPTDQEIIEGADGAVACTPTESRVKTKANYTGDGSAHKHDGWAGQTTIVIFDKKVETFGGGGWFEMPGAIVQPGTGRVDFKLSWDAVTTGAERNLYYDMPGDQRGTGADMLNHKFTASGQNHSFSVNMSNNDPPHATRSTWTFKVSESRPTTVTWTIHRGYDCLPFDPPHYNGWGNATQKLVWEGQRTHRSVLLCREPHSCSGSGLSYGFTPPGDNDAVPPGTSRIVVALKWSQSNTKLGLEFVSPVGKGGSTSATWEQATSYKDTSATSREFELALAPEDWDSFYVTSTAWYFNHYIDNGALNSVLFGSGVFDGTVDWKVVAYRGST